MNREMKRRHLKIFCSILYSIYLKLIIIQFMSHSIECSQNFEIHINIMKKTVCIFHVIKQVQIDHIMNESLE